ncbi:MAG: type II toxin-antitoxin system prevent-host-death family antitoxin [Mesorhizobium sp.]|nr:MAG: type II toxin-antitoxin system prevent-host-death family antitoxin [Mesorhizobium sp.]TIV63211.1 MAG: type II toxin-antitoxin system prevent-host-death family antitoxin [Mesorhizobium sp.]TIW00048.1 MAG: type II toxin-antitoxin system prevent-host-death family antitoxin [Mesorhizobium sp.]
MDWDLQKAGKNLPKLIKQAREAGPQTVAQDGKPVAVLLAVADYEKLIGAKPSLAEYLLSGPEWDDEFVEEVNRRPETIIRDIDL